MKLGLFIEQQVQKHWHCRLWNQKCQFAIIFGSQQVIYIWHLVTAKIP